MGVTKETFFTRDGGGKDRTYMKRGDDFLTLGQSLRAAQLRHLLSRCEYHSSPGILFPQLMNDTHKS
jgi:hypothetical protein